MALSQIKTNNQKRETKDEPQTNGSYKIRQMIIKIMEYTHIHIHPREKSKQSNKNKVQSIYPANKGNKKLHLPIKNKTNEAQTGKQNKARCQVGNKAMKTKLRNMLRGKERKKRERIDMQS